MFGARGCAIVMTDWPVIMKSPLAAAVPAVDKRLAILAAARRLLVARGFGDIVLDDVARDAGVAKGTLFLYFKNKEDLFVAVFEDLVDRLGASLDTLLTSDLRGAALLEATVRTILSHFDQNHDFVSQFSSGRLPGCASKACGKILEKFGENYARVVGLLRRCAEDGLVAEKSVEYAAAALFGLCRTAAMRHMMLRRHSPLERQADQLVEFFLHGAAGKSRLRAKG